MSNFNENFKRIISQKKLSLKIINEATGIPVSTLSEWTCDRAPNLNRSIVKLAKYLGVTIEYLIEGKESEEEIIKNLFKEEEFVQVHRGVYRITVEKCKDK